MRSVFLAVAAMSFGGCTLIAGVGDFTDALPSTTASSGGAPSSTGTSTNTGASGGGVGGGSGGGGGSPTSAYATLVLQRRPLAYFRLGEGVSATSVTSEVNNLTGSPLGTISFGAPGAIFDDPNTAALFDGMSGCIDFGNAPSLDFGASSVFTIEAWVKLGSAATEPIVAEIVSKLGSDGTGQTGAANGYHFGLNSSAHLRFRMLSGVSTSVDSIIADMPLDPSQFSHVAVTVDANNLARLFVNGVQATNAVTLGTEPSPTNGQFAVGCRIRGANTLEDYYAGTVDEVAIYDKVLDGTEILEHYTVGIGQ